MSRSQEAEIGSAIVDALFARIEKQLPAAMAAAAAPIVERNLSQAREDMQRLGLRLMNGNVKKTAREAVAELLGEALGEHVRDFHPEGAKS